MGPLVKRVWWLLGRLLVLVVVLVVLFAGVPWQAPIMWLIFGYVLVRALPGIGGDVARLRGLLRLNGGRYSVRRGGEF